MKVIWFVFLSAYLLNATASEHESKSNVLLTCEIEHESVKSLTVELRQFPLSPKDQAINAIYTADPDSEFEDEHIDLSSSQYTKYMIVSVAHYNDGSSKIVGSYRLQRFYFANLAEHIDDVPPVFNISRDETLRSVKGNYKERRVYSFSNGSGEQAKRINAICTDHPISIDLENDL